MTTDAERTSATAAPSDTAVAALGPVVRLPITAVRPAPDNPRKISTRAVEQVAKSLLEFGWQQPLVVDSSGLILVGHTRYRAAQALGLGEVPVTVAENLTDEQARAYRIVDNRTSDFTTWDLPALTVQLEELAAEFSDVLALADWQGILADFDRLTEDGPAPPLDLDPDPDLAIYAGERFSLVIVLDSERAARAFAEWAVEQDGVLDVRDRRMGGKPAK